MVLDQMAELMGLHSGPHSGKSLATALGSRATPIVCFLLPFKSQLSLFSCFTNHRAYFFDYSLSILYHDNGINRAKPFCYGHAIELKLHKFNLLDQSFCTMICQKGVDDVCFKSYTWKGCY